VKHVPRTPLDTWVKAKVGLPAHQELTRGVLVSYQLEKLISVLEYVKRCSPFYRQCFAEYDPRSVTSLEDLSGWPLTTSEDLRSDPLALLCVSQSAVQRVVTLRTRTEYERPQRLFFSPADLELAVDFFHHGFSTQVAPGQRMLVLMPCAKPHSVGDLLARGLTRLGVEAIPYGPMQSPEAVADAILRHDIDCLVGVPAEMEALARYPGITRIPRGQIRSVWLGTQNSRECDVEEIGRLWGCPVFQHYGAAVMCPGGGVECAAREGFHLREADVIIEIVDPRTTRPAADGIRGEVVVTTLTREAMPLVRYRTGHMAAMVAAPCPCGSELRRITSLRGETY
jgi:phenylacetate-CoA ligase